MFCGAAVDTRKHADAKQNVGSRPPQSIRAPRSSQLNLDIGLKIPIVGRWIECAHNGSVNRCIRYLWAGPTTVVGLVVALALIRRGRVACVNGVVEAHSPLLERALALLTPLASGADAMTLGHVVLGRNARALDATRAHERVHVRQYEVWGPFFLPAYFLASAHALATGRHPYFDNRFEMEARQECNEKRKAKNE
jgi:hypothetical protein